MSDVCLRIRGSWRAAAKGIDVSEFKTIQRVYRRIVVLKYLWARGGQIGSAIWNRINSRVIWSIVYQSLWKKQNEKTNSSENVCNT